MRTPLPLLERLNLWRRVPLMLVAALERLTSIGEDVRGLVAYVTPPRPPRRHFVALLVFAGSPTFNGPRVGGATLELVEGDGPRMLEFRWDGPRPLGEGLALVFCDLAAVQVDNFFRGTDLLGLNLACGAPLAVFAELEPGVVLRAAVRLRGSS